MFYVFSLIQICAKPLHNGTFVYKLFIYCIPEYSLVCESALRDK